MLSPYQAADALEAGERRGRLLWERRLLLAFGDGVAVAITFLIALNLRSAEIRHEFFAVPGWPMLVVLVTWMFAPNWSTVIDWSTRLTPGPPLPPRPRP